MIKPKKSFARKRFVIESFALILIALTPFIFKIHEYLPRNPEEVFYIFGIEIHRNGFPDVSTYIWFLIGKIIPLYLLIIWFFTCKHWWYHILLIPMCMYAFQIFEVLFSDKPYVDTDNVLWLLPVCMIVIPFVYFVRLKLYDKYVHGIDLELLNAELQWYKDKEANQKQKPKLDPSLDSSNPNEDLSSETPKRILSGFFRNLF